MRKLFFIILGFYVVVSVSTLGLASYAKYHIKEVLAGRSFPDNKVPTLNKAVVKINARCSGFIVEPSIIITASHCINGAIANVQFYDYKTKVFAVDDRYAN